MVRILYIIGFLFLVLSACIGRKQKEYGVIPSVKSEIINKGNTCFEDSVRIYLSPEFDPLYNVLAEEIFLLYNFRASRVKGFEIADIFIEKDANPKAPEEYSITIKDKIRVAASTYNAAALATVTILQAARLNNNSICFRNGLINDKPDLSYRGVLIDPARREHGIESLKQIVKLCRWYKLNYIQLHLTDDQAFTFPSAAFPQLVTSGRHFTEQELRSLVEFAHINGIELVPELEVPGHASHFINSIPEIFAFKNQELNRGTINMANERVYPVLDTLIGEIARIFKYSKYIHIGGDEADFEGMNEDPEVQEYLQKNNLGSIQELYWQLINRMNSFVRKRNKTAIVWEGFPKEGNAFINKDIVVMAWETMYQLPQDLIAAGFRILNVSWKPLYVVNERKWSAEYIFEWNPYRWENWLPKAPSYKPIQIDPVQQVLGGSMASWDQPEYAELSSLRRRLPAMVENLWNVEKVHDTEVFIRLLNGQNRNLSSYLSPIRFSATGLNHPNIADGRYDEQTWFDDTVRFTLTTNHQVKIRFTTDGREVTSKSPVYTAPVFINNSTLLKYRAFDDEENPVGTQTTRFFDLRPLHVNYAGDFLVHPDSIWAEPDNWLIPYSGSVVITIRSPSPGIIRYSLSKNGSEGDFIPYTRPIVLTDTSIVKVEARLYIKDSLTGKPWIQHFRRDE